MFDTVYILSDGKNYVKSPRKLQAKPGFSNTHTNIAHAHFMFSLAEALSFKADCISIVDNISTYSIYKLPQPVLIETSEICEYYDILRQQHLLTKRLEKLLPSIKNMDI